MVKLCFRQRRERNHGSPTCAQSAKAGIWEDAWKLDVYHLPGEQVVVAYLQDTGEAALEVFFGEAFFGLRFRGGESSVAQNAIACIHALQASLEGVFSLKRCNCNWTYLIWDNRSHNTPKQSNLAAEARCNIGLACRYQALPCLMH